MASLLVKKGPAPGSVVELQGRRMWVGRGPGNDVMLEDRTVSRQHAVLVRRSSGWHVQDLKSQNNTLVNGECVQSARLLNGDEVRFGAVVLTFVDEGTAQLGVQVRQSEERAAEVTQVIRLRDIVGTAVETRDERVKQDLRLSHLLRLAEVASSVQSVPAFLEGVVQSLQIAMPADLVLPFLYGRDGKLRPFIARRGDFVDDTSGLGIDRSLLERCLKDGPLAAHRRADDGIAIACVPIRTGAENLGLVYCERHGTEGPYTDAELRYGISVGVMTGLVVTDVGRIEQMERRNDSLARQLEGRYDMVGESEVMRQVFDTIRKAAPTDAGVLICGESGTGKEMVARAVHRNSHRSKGPFEVVNCAAVPEALVESELFGHAKGAFTGAVADKRGRFELADGGSLFLDEIADLALQCQAKLLRALEEGCVRRLGETQDRLVDVRLIAASNRDLRAAQDDGHFRSDLFYRLDRLRIMLPPLRERRGDVVLLAEYALKELAEKVKHPVSGFAPEVLAAFQNYGWPGNVRELRNVVERMVILAEEPVLGPELLPDDLRSAVSESAMPTLAQLERDHIAQVLSRVEGNKTRAAEMLGIDRSTLYAKIERYELDG